MSEHVNSYYAATAGDAGRRAPLGAQEAADVCVVGAGFAGLSTALELARRGVSVIVLEAHRVGWGASGRNGGFVTAGFALGLDTLISEAGLDQARELYGLSRDGVRQVAGYIEELGLDTAEQRSGFVSVMRTDQAQAVQQERD
ncbi:MAG: NAD(P)/FAD-dependent oxidoreductase, partial [Hyphomicrobiales bacterium]